MMAASKSKYKAGMSVRGRRLQEMVRALGVIALVFLNFGHVPVAAQVVVAVAPIAVSDDSGLCSQVPDDRHQEHAPCQACRIASGADLPPPPCSVEPAYRLIHPVYYPDDRPAVRRHAIWRNGAPRGPPALG